MEKLTLLPYSLPGKIYRSPMPFSRMYDPEHEVFTLYRQAGVSHAVILPPQEELMRQTGFNLMPYYYNNGIDIIACPVMDFFIPADGSFEKTIQQVIKLARSGETIAIHCHAGIGRTGMFAACLTRELWGWTADDAIAWVRQFIPEAVETEFQVHFVQQYKGIL